MLFAAAFLIALAAAGARAAGPEGTIESSGIRFPGGFDVNTLGEVRGTVTGVAANPDSGPVRFGLASGRDSYTVFASPAWYWGELKVDLAEGSEVVVRGSKTVGRDGRLYVVAQEMKIVKTDAVVSFRGCKGEPIWTGAAAAGGGQRAAGGNCGSNGGWTGGGGNMGNYMGNKGGGMGGYHK